jgi:Asp-tRNA(Asn)/Glu-tRNA(Gln) amidotransferase A subunit family amidase
MLPAVFEEIDVLLTPAVSGEAPLGLASTGDPRFQSLWTLLHVPTITLPTHTGPHGLPVGIQLVGPLYADRRLLAVASYVSELLAA